MIPFPMLFSALGGARPVRFLPTLKIVGNSSIFKSPKDGKWYGVVGGTPAQNMASTTVMSAYTDQKLPATTLSFDYQTGYSPRSMLITQSGEIYYHSNSGTDVFGNGSKWLKSTRDLTSLPFSMSDVVSATPYGPYGTPIGYDLLVKNGTGKFDLYSIPTTPADPIVKKLSDIDAYRPEWDSLEAPGWYIKNGDLYLVGINTDWVVSKDIATNVSATAIVGKCSDKDSISIGKGFVVWKSPDGKWWSRGRNLGQNGEVDGVMVDNTDVSAYLANVSKFIQIYSCSQPYTTGSKQVFRVLMYEGKDGKIYAAGDNGSCLLGTGAPATGASEIRRSFAVVAGSEVLKVGEYQVITADRSDYCPNLVFVQRGKVYGLGKRDATNPTTAGTGTFGSVPNYFSNLNSVTELYDIPEELL